MKNNTSLIKLIAIYSVICAHVWVQCGDDIGTIIQRVYYYFGSIGVGLFFIISGSSNSKNESSTLSNLYHLRSFLFPWMISGVVVFTYLHVRKTDLPFSILDFIIGNGSYLYFMTVYSFITIISFVFKNKIIRLIILIASLIYNTIGIKLAPNNIGEYLNPLLWLPYFIFGYMLVIEKLNFVKIIKSFEFLLITIFGFLFILRLYYFPQIKSQLNYQNSLLIFIVCTIYLFISNMNVINIKMPLSAISKNTLFIYLWHMPIAGILNYYFNRHNCILHLLTPLIILSIFAMIIILANRFAHTIKICSLIGLRQ